MTANPSWPRSTVMGMIRLMSAWTKFVCVLAVGLSSGCKDKSKNPKDTQPQLAMPDDCRAAVVNFAAMVARAQGLTGQAARRQVAAVEAQELENCLKYDGATVTCAAAAKTLAEYERCSPGHVVGAIAAATNTAGVTKQPPAVVDPADGTEPAGPTEPSDEPAAAPGEATPAATPEPLATESDCRGLADRVSSVLDRDSEFLAMAKEDQKTFRANAARSVALCQKAPASAVRCVQAARSLADLRACEVPLRD